MTVAIARQLAAAVRRSTVVGSRRPRYGICLMVAVVISACSGTSLVRVDQQSPTPTLTMPSVMATLPASIAGSGRRLWTNMHSDHRPRGPITYGRGDIDGDGRPNMVIVDYRTHIAVARVGDRYLWVLIPADASTRLQAVPDLWGDGRHEILVARSTTGCCGYRSTDSQALVLGYRGGRLALLRRPDGRVFTLAFSLGREDVFAGVRCRGPELSQRTVTQARRHQLRVTETDYRVVGTVVRLVRQTTSVKRGSNWQRATALSSSSCPGMSKYGWAG